MYIRRRLISLVGLSLLPVLVFSTVMAVIFWRQQRLAFEQQFLERVRAMSIALDRMLEGSTTLLLGLASSPELDRGDLRGFYERARRVAAAQPDWATVAVIDPATGRELLNLLQPFGESPAPSEASTDAFRRALTTGAPVVSGLVRSSARGVLSTHVFVPVIRDGATRYVLDAAVDSAVWLKFLASYPIDSGATMTLIDKDGTVIARTLNNDRWAGRRLAAAQLAGTLGSSESAKPSVGLEGQSFYGAHSRSRIAGWTIGTGVPTGSVEGALWWSTFGVVFGAGVSMMVAILLAIGLGGRITQPVTRLVARVRALATDQRPPNLPRTGIGEFDEVAQAFDETGRLLEQQDSGACRAVGARAGRARGSGSGQARGRGGQPREGRVSRDARPRAAKSARRDRHRRPRARYAGRRRSPRGGPSRHQAAGRAADAAGQRPARGQPCRHGQDRPRLPAPGRRGDRQTLPGDARRDRPSHGGRPAIGVGQRRRDAHGTSRDQLVDQCPQVHAARRRHHRQLAYGGRRDCPPRQRHGRRDRARRAAACVRSVRAGRANAGPIAGRPGHRPDAGSPHRGAPRRHDHGGKRGDGTRQHVHRAPAARVGPGADRTRGAGGVARNSPADPGRRRPRGCAPDAVRCAPDRRARRASGGRRSGRR